MCVAFLTSYAGVMTNLESYMPPLILNLQFHTQSNTSKHRLDIMAHIIKVNEIIWCDITLTSHATSTTFMIANMDNQVYFKRSGQSMYGTL